MTFGGELTPELFDKRLPSNTPLRRGEMPVHPQITFSDSPPSALKQRAKTKTCLEEKKVNMPAFSFLSGNLYSYWEFRLIKQVGSQNLKKNEAERYLESHCWLERSSNVFFCNPAAAPRC